jgi:hypothetical protein
MKNKLLPTLVISIMVLTIVAPIVPAKASTKYWPDFGLDAWYSSGGLNQEIELYLSNAAVPSPQITLPNLGHYDEFEWWKGTSTTDTQFFWGPDCMLIGGVDDHYGGLPVGGGALSLSYVGPSQVMVTGSLVGYFSPTHTTAIFLFNKLVVDNDFGVIVSGSLTILSGGHLYGSSDAYGDPDYGHWYPQGQAAWFITLSSTTPGWSIYDLYAYPSD